MNVFNYKRNTNSWSKNWWLSSYKEEYAKIRSPQVLLFRGNWVECSLLPKLREFAESRTFLCVVLLAGIESWHALISPSSGGPTFLLPLTLSYILFFSFTFCPLIFYHTNQSFPFFSDILLLNPKREFIWYLCSFLWISSSSESFSILWAGYHLLSFLLLAYFLGFLDLYSFLCPLWSDSQPPLQ